ncbi:MAG: hypothetical protein MJ208_00730 [Bacilli bacterium]|nr:hypothetical protein [Bacilli bacterium]
MLDLKKVYTKEEFRELLVKYKNSGRFPEYITGYDKILKNNKPTLHDYYIYLPHDNYIHNGKYTVEMNFTSGIPQDKDWEDSLGYFTITRFNEINGLIDFAKEKATQLNLGRISPDSLNKDNKERAERSGTDFVVKNRNKSFYEGYYSGIIGVLRYILGCGELDRIKHCDEILISYASKDYK